MNATTRADVMGEVFVFLGAGPIGHDDGGGGDGPFGAEFRDGGFNRPARQCEGSLGVVPRAGPRG